MDQWMGNALHNPPIDRNKPTGKAHNCGYADERFTHDGNLIATFISISATCRPSEPASDITPGTFVDDEECQLVIDIAYCVIDVSRTVVGNKNNLWNSLKHLHCLLITW